MYWRNVGAWNPFEEMRNLQRQMNRLFEGYDDTGISSLHFPAMNVWGNSDEVVITAALPGVAKEDIELTIIDNQLTIKGERKEDVPVENAVCHRRERDAGKFVRSIRLPFAVENDKVTANYKDGILTVTLLRQEETKPKKIEIKAS